MVKIVSVKFKEGGKVYYFAPGKEQYEKGMGVIVETAKGLEYATVVQPAGEVNDDEVVAPLKPIVRIATKRDEEQVARNKERRKQAIINAQQKAEERQLEMKIVDCEFAFDGSKVTFYFTSESRVDFRELIKDLSSFFHMRIELRQINIRDEIKLIGGLAPCGRPCCCIGSLQEPKKVSVKMAKNQGLSLNPAKISGLCGRLMCCLSYENDYYAEACKQVPKIGSEAETPDGKGIVVNVNMLKMLVKVKIEQGESVSFHEYGVNDIRFKRGNVVMGKEDLGEEEPEDESIEEQESAPELEEAQPEREQPHRNKNKRRHGNKNRGEGQSDNRGDNHTDNRNENRDNRNDKREGGDNRENRRDNRHDKGNHGRGNDNRNQNNQGGQNNNQGGNPVQLGENANKMQGGRHSRHHKPKKPAPDGAPQA